MSSPSTRSRLADQLRRAKVGAAEQAVANFYTQHPDWVARYGERGLRLSIEDAGYFVDFLAASVETGEPVAFGGYVQWVVGMLGARHVPASVVEESLGWLEQALQPLFDPAGQTVLRDHFAAGLMSATEPVRAEPPSPADALALTRDVFVQACLTGQRQAALGIVSEAMRQGHAVADIYLRVFQDALYEVGRRWEGALISVAEEHVATAVVQYVIAQMYPRLERSTTSRGRMVVAGVQTELHQVGANIIADMLEADGWDVRFLGTNMPHDGIIQAVRDHRADLVGLSATMLFNVPHVSRLVQDIRTGFVTNRPRILLGGAAFRVTPSLWQDVGADGCAHDLASAIPAARELATRPGG